MVNVEIKKMNGGKGTTQRDVARVFVEGYYDVLSMLCKNKKILVNIFEGSFNENVFYVAIAEGKPLGITACSNNKGRALILDKKKFKRCLGFFKGTFAYNAMKKDFIVPLNYPDNTAYIECVATVPQARGKGIATELMKFLLRELPYTQYILEVTDTNVAAKSIYEKLGFKISERKREKFAKIKGFTERIYMKINITR